MFDCLGSSPPFAVLTGSRDLLLSTAVCSQPAEPRPVPRLETASGENRQILQLEINLKEMRAARG